MGNARTCFHVNGPTEYSRCQDYVLHLVGHHSVVYYELLKSSETISGGRYRTQLMRLSRTLKDKRPQYQERYEISQDNR